ncbi:MAG: hypothetical protein Q9184_006520 [Pyrenodesmia sp. 2 TL-2023]
MSAACTQLTIERGSDPRAQDIFSRTALHYACMSEEPQKEVLGLLIKAGVRTGTVDLDGKIAEDYHRATRRGHYVPHEVVAWVCGKLWTGCYEMSYGGLRCVLDNSRFHQRNYAAVFSERIRENSKTSAEQEKTWSVVSNSDEEDFELVDE